MNLRSIALAFLLSSGASSACGTGGGGEVEIKQAKNHATSTRRLMADQDVPGGNRKLARDDETGEEGDGILEALEEIDQDGHEGDNAASLRNGNRGSTYQKYSSRGCRNRFGGRGSTSCDYDLYWSYNNVGSCKRKCDSLGRKCFGYEWSQLHFRCEIWRVPIYHVQHVSNLYCYVKTN